MSFGFLVFGFQGLAGFPVDLLEALHLEGDLRTAQLDGRMKPNLSSLGAGEMHVFTIGDAGHELA